MRVVIIINYFLCAFAINGKAFHLPSFEVHSTATHQKNFATVFLKNNIIRWNGRLSGVRVATRNALIPQVMRSDNLFCSSFKLSIHVLTRDIEETRLIDVMAATIHEIEGFPFQVFPAVHVLSHGHAYEWMVIGDVPTATTSPSAFGFCPKSKPAPVSSTPSVPPAIISLPSTSSAPSCSHAPTPTENFNSLVQSYRRPPQEAPPQEAPPQTHSPNISPPRPFNPFLKPATPPVVQTSATVTSSSPSTSTHPASTSPSPSTSRPAIQRFIHTPQTDRRMCAFLSHHVSAIKETRIYEQLRMENFDIFGNTTGLALKARFRRLCETGKIKSFITDKIVLDAILLRMKFQYSKKKLRNPMPLQHVFASLRHLIKQSHPAPLFNKYYRKNFINKNIKF